MPTKSSPDPRKTVAKNLSSRSPRRLRITPMNHRNAMPAKGIRLNAKATEPRLDAFVIQTPRPVPLGGIAEDIMTMTVPSINENRIPATAAALGVRRSRPSLAASVTGMVSATGPASGDLAAQKSADDGKQQGSQALDRQESCALSAIAARILSLVTRRKRWLWCRWSAPTSNKLASLPTPCADQGLVDTQPHRSAEVARVAADHDPLGWLRVSQLCWPESGPVISP